MRRLEPRPLASAVHRVARRVAPATPLARVQRLWPEVVGERVAREADPVSERDGTVVVACRSAVWSQELTLLSDELSQRLNDAVARADGGRPVRGLRFVTRSGARRL